MNNVGGFIRTVLIALTATTVVLALAACAHERARKPATSGPAAARFASAVYGVTMIYMANLSIRHGFRRGYFLGDRWNPDAADSTPGEGLLTLTLPESNKLVTGALRLGVSNNSSALSGCRLPDDGNAGPVSTVVIDGVRFKRRDTGDAGMNHFLQRHAYRGVAHGHCYAIDLIADGTNPGVYPGNLKPPMSRRAAFKRLTMLLDGLTFSAR